MASSTQFGPSRSVAAPEPRQPAGKTGWLRTLVEILVIGGLYFALARLGQLTAIAPGNVSAVYPPAGLAVVCVLLRGNRIWPGIWIGQFLGSTWAFLDASSAGMALRTVTVGGVISFGAVAQAIVGATLILRWCGRRYPFDTVKDVYRFAGSGVTACVLSSSIGVASLAMGGVLDGTRIASTWGIWYLGDTTGYVVVGSALLILVRRNPPAWRGWAWLELLGLLTVALATSISVFTDSPLLTARNLPMAFLPLPVIMWAAVRFDQRVVSIAILIFAIAAVFATADGRGPFSTPDTNLSIALLTLFIGICQITGLSMRAAFEQRFQAEEDLTRLNAFMEEAIQRRTAALEEQRRFLRQIIDVDPNFIFAKDREGRFTLVNQAVADAYGTSVDKLIGRKDSDFNPNQEEVEYFLKMDHEVMDTLEEKLIPEEPITDSEGHRRWLQTVKRPLIGSNGRADQILGSATDITERREIEEQLRESEASIRRNQDELRALTGRLMTAQEDEQRRLARHLHDDLTQWLAATGLQAGRLERLVKDPAPEVIELLRTMQTDLGRLSSDVHALSRRLHPSILEDLGLVDALASECAQFSEHEGIRTHFEADPETGGVPDEVALCLYRVTQESLRNVAKHSGATEASVSLRKTPTGLVLAVEDQGRGFDPGERRGRKGLGLVSMAERVRMINADIEISSGLGDGTLVQVSYPGATSTPR